MNKSQIFLKFRNTKVEKQVYNKNQSSFDPLVPNILYILSHFEIQEIQEVGSDYISVEVLVLKVIQLVYLLIILMGNCVGTSKNEKYKFFEAQKYKSLILEKEYYLLKLIYIDLGSRISQNEVNHENFLLFFHKNGYWGDRLFKQFDIGASNLITEQEFIKGMIKIFKTNEDHKIQLLFKFFSGSTRKQKGVRFSQFLTMLYNYPKQDFKKILNDEEFFNRALRKNLIADSNYFKGRRLDSISGELSKKNFFQTKFRVEENHETVSDRISSRVESQILEEMLKKNSCKSTSVKIKVGQNNVEVITTNIHNLVKRFAISIFKSYNINIRTGKFQFWQFRDWMIKHKQLYDDYYKGFHSEIWEINRKTMKPRFLEKQFEFSSFANIYVNDVRPKKVIISLLNSVLLICEEKDLSTPISIVCLDGLSTKRIFDEEKGNGIEITHRDEIYTTKRFYLKDKMLADEWMEHLKFYRGCSISMLYEMGEKIGVGKFSVVYNGKENSTGERHAIKVIQSSKLQEQAKKLIAHESSIMSIVSHPMLVYFKESILTKTHIYIVTELVEGKDMFQYVKDSKYLSEQQAAQIIRQILIRARYLHSLGIVHRDLKPENIMIQAGHNKNQINKIKIIDFGFANYLQSLKGLTTEEALAGTPNYIAPESLRLEPEITEKIDNFAIGSILYFALSGNLAFRGCNCSEILQNTLEGNYQINDKQWRTISNQAKDLVKKLLENDPKDRISTDEALMHPWLTKFPHIQA